jgi:hypothetical protein
MHIVNKGACETKKQAGDNVTQMTRQKEKIEKRKRTRIEQA